MADNAHNSLTYNAYLKLHPWEIDKNIIILTTCMYD